MYADDSIHIEKTDQCYTCEHFVKGVMCPLLEALALNIVELNGDVTVQNCGFYRQFSRHLRVIETPQTAEEAISEGDDENQAQNRSYS
jgi:queuine/archaeosine tRNA-ribosyltransferase